MGKKRMGRRVISTPEISSYATIRIFQGSSASSVTSESSRHNLSSMGKKRMGRRTSTD
jgi:hypothetical protein